MKRTPRLGLLAVFVECLLAGCPTDVVASDLLNREDPYEVCRDQGLSADQFNRCISAVYLNEMPGTDAMVDPELVLRGVGGKAGGSLEQCLRQNPCVFNPTTGTYQECRLYSAVEQCLEFAGTCTP
jgi:hypothetical protein